MKTAKGYKTSPKDRAYRIVFEVGKISFVGNTICSSWFECLTHEDGSTNPNAALVLSEIVYWYRPTEVRSEEEGGAVLGFRKKFKYHKLQMSQAKLGKKFRLTKRQVGLALDCLRSHGVITTEVVKVMRINGELKYNVPFIEIVPERLAEITYATWKSYDDEDDTEDWEILDDGSSDSATQSQDVPTHYASVPTQAASVAPSIRQRSTTKNTTNTTQKNTLGAAPPTPPATAVQPSLFDTTALTPESGDMQEDAEQTNCEHILDATPKADATSRRVANKGKQKVAKSDDQPKRKVSGIAQAVVYHEVFSKWPKLEQAEYLEKECSDLERLRNALKALQLTTDNRCNFFLIVKLYNQGATPESETQAARNGNGYNHSNYATARNTTNNRNGYSRNYGSIVPPVDNIQEDESGNLYRFTPGIGRIPL